jgi:hypothetical protein|tara:strand:+ start:67 stop:195 length:129 start_codon:yes stop_codon:yes gene_type:complete
MLIGIDQPLFHTELVESGQKLSVLEMVIQLEVRQLATVMMLL